MGSSGGLDNGLRESVLSGVGSLAWCLVGWQNGQWKCVLFAKQNLRCGLWVSGARQRTNHPFFRRVLEESLRNHGDQ